MDTKKLTFPVGGRAAPGYPMAVSLKKPSKFLSDSGNPYHVACLSLWVIYKDVPNVISCSKVCKKTVNSAKEETRQTHVRIIVHVLFNHVHVQYSHRNHHKFPSRPTHSHLYKCLTIFIQV